VHVATPDTLDGSTTRISHPWLDDDPTNMLLVTHVLNPGGTPTARNPHPISVRYVGVWGRWEIFNGDGAPMPPNAAFFVTILEEEGTLLHTALPEDTDFNWTQLSHAALNGNAGAAFVVTKYAGAPDTPDYTENPAEIGVYYFSGTWRIFNQDDSDMPLGTHFFVATDPRGRLAFTHDADGSIGGPTPERTVVDHISLNGLSLLSFHVTSNWNPPGQPGVYNDHPVGVVYDATSGKWAIENVDGAPIPAGASFNILIR
jgi:hypothetical protein